MTKETIAICLLDEEDNVLKSIKIKTRFNKKLSKELTRHMARHDCFSIKEAMASVIYNKIIEDVNVGTIKELLTEQKEN
jgi:hypothetical protein